MPTPGSLLQNPKSANKKTMLYVMLKGTNSRDSVYNPRLMGQTNDQCSTIALASIGKE